MEYIYPHPFKSVLKHLVQNMKHVINRSKYDLRYLKLMQFQLNLTIGLNYSYIILNIQYIIYYQLESHTGRMSQYVKYYNTKCNKLVANVNQLLLPMIIDRNPKNEINSYGIWIKESSA